MILLNDTSVNLNIKIFGVCIPSRTMLYNKVQRGQFKSDRFMLVCIFCILIFHSYICFRDILYFFSV